MYRNASFLLLFLLCSWLRAQDVIVSDSTTLEIEEPKDSVTLFDIYSDRLSALVQKYDSINANFVFPHPNAYYFKMMGVPTLFHAPLHQSMVKSDSLVGDIQLQNLYTLNQAFSRFYVESPFLVTNTESEIMAAGAFREDVKEKIEVKEKLSEKVNKSNLLPQLDEDVVVITRKPTFWKITGNTTLQFTQNHFSDNWYQGGENNYSGNSNINLRFDYDNQKKINMNVLAEFQLGFQTSASDKKRNFRPTNNRMCLTTNFGYKAVKTLYYSAQVRLLTQVVPNYKANSDVVTTDIFSPLDVTIAPGMKYEISIGKKKKLTGTLNVAPLAYSIRYCDRDELVRNYGIDPGHNSKHTFGPNVTLNTVWKIIPQITWSSNIYWFSNLESTKIEWTNTINFAVTKLISAQLIVFPRFDDSAVKFRSKSGSYFMFKEYFGMGLNYSF